ncbi:hypothetical protein [Bacillus sp. 1P06AnD]|uniref:hypothetical protein n=1 Tax=Bacillus sp. 1P06AnD TaxID=3132208 RepID=UPI0039A3AF34
MLKIELEWGVYVEFIVLIVLLVYLFDFTKFRQQNQTIIKQNEEMIALLKEIKEK